MTDPTSHTVCLNPLEITERLVRVETELGGFKDLMNVKLDKVELATGVAKVVMDERFHSANNMRDDVSEMQGSMMKRVDYEREHKVLSDRITAEIKTVGEKIAELKTFRDQMTGKADQSAVNQVQIIAIVGIGLSIIGIVVGVVLH